MGSYGSNHSDFWYQSSADSLELANEHSGLCLIVTERSPASGCRAGLLASPSWSGRPWRSRWAYWRIQDYQPAHRMVPDL
jgi:hypothetical protein